MADVTEPEEPTFDAVPGDDRHDKIAQVDLQL